jgi:hypothetical protein
LAAVAALVLKRRQTAPNIRGLDDNLHYASDRIDVQKRVMA